MVLLRCLQTQGNAGPHSFVGLLFSFQRPSCFPRPAPCGLEPSPTTAESRRRPCWLQGGAAYLPRPSRTVKRKTRRKVRTASRPEEPDYYIRLFHPVKRPGEVFFAVRLLKGRDFYPFTGFPVKDFGKLISLRRSSPRGAASIPSPGSPSRGRFLLQNHPAARGALCSPSEDFRQHLRFDFTSGPCCAAGPSSTGALCSQGPGRSQGRCCPLQAPTSAWPRRQRAATAAAAGSPRPARRARSCATMASMRASAASTSSFTTR